MKKLNLTGEVYGRLTIIEARPLNKWLCKCSCGNSIVADTNNIRSGHTKSCGCMEKENSIGICGDGLRKHILYGTWITMLYRCYKPNRKEYKNYGGRGITVCERWHTFQYFIDDVFPSYKPGLQLDRYPNNDGNYEPSNFRWTTELDNKRRTRRIKLDAAKVEYIKSSNKTAKELSEMFKCSRDTIYDVRQGKTWF